MPEAQTECRSHKWGRARERGFTLSGRRGVLENFEILDCRRCISEHILPLDSPKNFGTLKGIFFCKMYYNVVSVAAGEKQGYTKQFSRQLS